MYFDYFFKKWAHLTGAEQIMSIAADLSSYDDDFSNDATSLVIDTLNECGEKAVPLAKAYLFKVITERYGTAMIERMNEFL